MTSASPLRNRERALLLGLLLFCSYAYFDQGHGWNQDSRFDLTRAIVERRALRIDAYHANTFDKAYFNGHYYSDKAPGISLLAVPIWAADYVVERAAGRDLVLNFVADNGLYLSTVFVVGLLNALAAAVLFLLAVRLGASVNGAAFAAVIYGLGTPGWTYSTLFWGHAPAAALLLFAFAAAVALLEEGGARRDFRLGLLLGGCAGWAVVTDYTCAPAAVLLAGLALLNTRAGGWARARRVAAGIFPAAMACAAVLAAYNALAFHSPFRLGYSYVDPQFAGMRQDFGMRMPRLGVVREILFGRARGLLLCSPALIAAPAGLVLMWRKSSLRWSALAAACVALYYLVLAASYIFWKGGYTWGPRFLFPAVPFLCLMLAVLWSRSPGWVRSALLGAGLCSVALNLIAISTVAMPSQAWPDPMNDVMWPAFRMSLVPISGGSTNLGRHLGLSGRLSLVPLLILWGLAALAWGLQRDPRPELATSTPGAQAEITEAGACR